MSAPTPLSLVLPGSKADVVSRSLCAVFKSEGGMSRSTVRVGHLRYEASQPLTVSQVRFENSCTLVTRPFMYSGVGYVSQAPISRTHAAPVSAYSHTHTHKPISHIPILLQQTSKSWAAPFPHSSDCSWGAIYFGPGHGESTWLDSRGWLK